MRVEAQCARQGLRVVALEGAGTQYTWLTAIRREGESVGFWRFLRLGALVMPPALVLALGARLLGAAVFHA